MATTNIKPTTWFDCFPTEILFSIFDYLSNNDIMYTFFFFNRHFNNLFIQNQRYYNYLQLPTTNLNTWKNILPIIRNRVECLSINTTDLSFPVTFFPNLKSLTLFLPYGLSDEELRSFVQSAQFQNLHSFKIKESERKIFSHTSDDFRSEIHSIDCKYLLQEIFSERSSLKIFQYSLSISSLSRYNLETNFNLQSLILTLTDFQDIFSLIKYTPNLKYLNVQSQAPNRYTTLTNNSIKLEQLYLTLSTRQYYGVFDSNLLINCIKQFSSSLTDLTLNLVHTYVDDENEFPFNSIKLQHLLESMTELKRFHLYAALNNKLTDNETILLQFLDQYWLDHEWTFGMHGNYFYTLPFHFNHLHQFDEALNDIKSNKPEILVNNHRLWHNVTSIDLSEIPMNNINFIKEVQMKIPKLNFIKLTSEPSIRGYKRQQLFTDDEEMEQTDVRLYNVRGIEFEHSRSLENNEEWLISMAPNLCHLVLSNQEYPPLDSRLAPIFGEKIQRLDIYVDFQVDTLANMSYVYFSNVQYINLYFKEISKRSKWYEEITMKILENFTNLKKLLIYFWPERHFTVEFLLKDRNLYTDEILKNYEVKHFRKYSTFLNKQL